MKAIVVCQIVVICMILTIMCIFTIDGVNIKKAELQQVINCDVTAIVKMYFDGEVTEEDLYGKLETVIKNSIQGKYDGLNIRICYSDSSRCIISLLIEETYRQANGTYRTLSERRTFIKEVLIEEGKPTQSYIRTISKEYYRNSNGYFIDYLDGGVPANSIWRTPDYAQALDLALSQ